MILSSTAFPLLHKYASKESFVNLKEYKLLTHPMRIVISSEIKDLIWLEENKEQLTNARIYLAIIDNDVCIKIGKNISGVIYFNTEHVNSINDSNSHKENSIIFNNIINQSAIIAEIITQKICIIGGCYRYGLMTWFTRLEKMMTETKLETETNTETETEMFIVKYEGYNYCVISFNLSDEISLSYIRQMAERYNFKLCAGVPQSGTSHFPLHCPGDSVFTVENIKPSSIPEDILCKMVKEELRDLMKCSV
jgi:hypothetical protein